MDFEPLIKLILKNNPNADFKIIKKAYDYAKHFHHNQLRKSEEPFFIHPYEVVKILATMNSQSATICAGFLHDIVEDSEVSINSIKKEFGEEIATLVEGVTKIDKVHFDSKEDYTAENLRKVLLATAKDVRVMLIKLADRLHNMRTLKAFREDKQKRIAKETMEIYAPIAHKLGIWRIKGELEDLSMRYLMPETYHKISQKINEKREHREKKTNGIINDIKTALRIKGIKATIIGRAKYFYSIYKKMIKKNVEIDEIYDLIAIRLIVETIPQCYAALGVVHELYKPIPRRFKDYISNPKANGYQSLHTVLEGSTSTVIEVQIRTYDMNRVAEYGIAAHWRYQGTERDKKFDKRISWIKQFLEWRSDSSEARKFIESLKMDLFEDEIVVFTPKGDPINLKEGSTPVDFAFEVHTSLGLKCAKSLVNNKLVPLDSVLQPGDIVEIITHKNIEPSRQWLNFIKTSKAKSKIRSYFKLTIEKQKHDKEIDNSEFFDDLAKKIQLPDKKWPLRISKCCSPKRGDKIVGIYTKDKKITIHKEGCDNIKGIDEKRKVSLSWKESKRKKRITISIVMKDKVGNLAELLNFFSIKKISILKVQAKPKKDKTFHTLVEIEQDKIDKEELKNELRSKKDVIDVQDLKISRTKS